jgi:hypothetical protein
LMLWNCDGMIKSKSLPRLIMNIAVKWL